MVRETAASARLTALVETIGATRTSTGRTVEAVLDTNEYPAGYASATPR